MYCQQCSEAVEPDAAFCGNCGQALAMPVPLPPAPFRPPSTASEAETNVSPDSASAAMPAYAVADPAQQKGETRAMVGLIVAVLAIPAAAVPLLGWSLAIAGLIMATTVRRRLARKLMANLAITFSAIGLVLSVGVFVYITQVQTKSKAGTMTAQSSSAGDGTAVAQTGVSAIVDTPCYSVTVVGLSMVNNAKGSCSAQVYDGDTLGGSNQALVVDAVKQDEITTTNFATASEQLVDEYLAGSLPGFSITSQQPGSFAGSKAYIVDAKNMSSSTTMQLGIVLHTSDSGENLFVVAHARNGAQADLAGIAKTWEWK